MLARTICSTLFVVCFVQSFPSQYLAWSGRHGGHEGHPAGNFEADISRHKNIPEYVHDLLQLYYLRLAQEAMDNLFHSFNLDTSHDVAAGSHGRPAAIEASTPMGDAAKQQESRANPGEEAGPFQQELAMTSLSGADAVREELAPAEFHMAQDEASGVAHEVAFEQATIQQPVVRSATAEHGLFEEHQHLGEGLPEDALLASHNPSVDVHVFEDNTTGQVAVGLQTGSHPPIVSISVELVTPEADEHKNASIEVSHPVSTVQSLQVHEQNVSTSATTAPKQTSEDLSTPLQQLVTGANDSVHNVSSSANLGNQTLSQDLTDGHATNVSTEKASEMGQREEKPQTGLTVTEGNTTAVSGHSPTTSSPEHRSSLNESVQPQQVSSSSQNQTTILSVGASTGHPSKEQERSGDEAQAGELVNATVATPTTVSLESKSATAVTQSASLATLNETVQLSEPHVGGQEVKATTQ